MPPEGGAPPARHPRHAVALVEAVVAREQGRQRRAPLVPAAVGVEAGWDRRAREAAAINRLRIVDAPRDGTAANRAAGPGAALRISVAGAHSVPSSPVSQAVNRPGAGSRSSSGP